MITHSLPVDDSDVNPGKEHIIITQSTAKVFCLNKKLDGMAFQQGVSYIDNPSYSRQDYQCNPSLLFDYQRSDNKG